MNIEVIIQLVFLYLIVKEINKKDQLPSLIWVTVQKKRRVDYSMSLS